MSPPVKQILVDLRHQRLLLLLGEETLINCPVSSSREGPGEQIGSGRTPRGRHKIRVAIGAGCPLNSVFVGRRPTGEIFTPELAVQHPGRDWILTRILWLTGCEPGRNRGGNLDTLRRYIYIHGCPDTEPMGVPRSHGCIRMRNADMLALFEQVEAGILADIREET